MMNRSFLNRDQESIRPASAATLSAVAAWLSVFLAFQLVEPRPAEAARGEEFVKHLRYLSSDGLRGRGNDMPELNWAAHYIARNFRRCGLMPGGDDGTYFQEFSIVTGVRQGSENEVTLFGIPQSAVRLEAEKDYFPLTFGGEPVIGPLAFAGFGISAPEYGYDDYRDLDVRGKVVVVYEHEPQEHSERSVFAGRDLTEYATVMAKVLTAKSRGAAAVILLPDSFNHGERWEGGGDRDLPLDDLGIQTIRLSDRLARRLIEISGRDSRQIRRWINGHLTPYSFDFEGVNAVLRLDIQPIVHRVDNVVGVVPGWSEEAVVLGAHYDHLGLGGKSSLAPDRVGEVHNGADDNASGTAGLIQLACEAALSKPRRSLVFAAFAGEELGLLGSRHYVERPVVPLENTAAMLNMDMIGRSDGDLLIGGVGTAEEFKPILNALSRSVSLSFKYAETPGGSSDHLSFALKGVPVLFFFSGLHSDYHRPTDDWQKIDVERTQEILEVVRGVVEQLEETPGPLKFVDLAGRTTEAPTRSDQHGPLFGSIPDMSFDDGGVRFEQILKGSPADQAGLRAGDVLVQLAGRQIENLHDFSTVLRAKKAGDVVEALALRQGVLQVFQVVLAQR